MMRAASAAMLNNPVDVSRGFTAPGVVYFHAARMEGYNPRGREGTVIGRRYHAVPQMDFDRIVMSYKEAEPWEFPPDYGTDLALRMRLDFVTPRTMRLRLNPSASSRETIPSLMIPAALPRSGAWRTVRAAGAGTCYAGTAGSVTVRSDPWALEWRDPAGVLLTSTYGYSALNCLHNAAPTPFTVARDPGDFLLRMAASFHLAPGEKIVGCGESFQRLNHRGHRVVLCTVNPFGNATADQYKPIPFFMSSRGYGMFLHTSTPLTFDFGHAYEETATLYLGDANLDLFVFLGTPKQILSEYTALTGRTAMPPLWSFGYWQSRISYASAREVRDVARKLRRHRIPADVIHIDTNWFEHDWQCDFRFSKRRFPDPKALFAELRRQGFRASLWQFTYLTPKNPLYAEALAKGYVIRDADGNLPSADAMIDLSNPRALAWYQGKIAALLRLGAAAIKVDFGEGAPLRGQYASGKSGLYEHNLYPLRYNKAVAEITHEVTGEWIIWARSAWAGSQRYPLHWGADAESRDVGMAVTLKGGLSAGLSGFSFWSHDIGGFWPPTPEPLYRRWVPFGMLSSHSRAHGMPPTEPWEFSDGFLAGFRAAVQMRYRLMPYLYAQSRLSSAQGHPLMRALLFEHPEDPTAWFVDDEYLLGPDLLVAPMLEEAASRQVYLPAGAWIDYQTGRIYEGGRWHAIACPEQIPIVVLAREGSVIPHIGLAQHTGAMDWRALELRVFSQGMDRGAAPVLLPGDAVVREVRVDRAKAGYRVTHDPFDGTVAWTITTCPIVQP